MKPKKLIRSKITEKLQEGEWETITDQTELNKLYALKIQEELAEIQASDHKDIMEFVDLIHVVGAFAEENGFSIADIFVAECEKVNAKGSFGRLALNNLNPDNPSNKLYFEDRHKVVNHNSQYPEIPDNCIDPSKVSVSTAEMFIMDFGADIDSTQTAQPSIRPIWFKDEVGAENELYKVKAVGRGKEQDSDSPSQYTVGVDPTKAGSEIESWVGIIQNGALPGRSIKDVMEEMVKAGDEHHRKMFEIASPTVTADYSKKAKKLARQLRRKKSLISLTNILINLRSYYGAQWINEKVKKALLNKGLVWSYGKRNEVLEITRDYEFQFTDTRIVRPARGHKTYFHEGKYYSEDPNIDYPF